MSRSILIIGGTQKERADKAKSYFPVLTPHPDFLEIVPEISIGIAQIRNIQHFASLHPYSQDYKVVYIEEAQKLTIEAQNAFLKTLEEPPEKTLIILTSPSANNLLPTIISRCQIVSIKNNYHTNQNYARNLIFEEFISLVYKPLGETFSYSAISLANRESTLEWVNNIQNFLYCEFHRSQKLSDNQFSLTNTQYKSLQCVLENVKKRISRNVNPRFVLENFFLEIEEILPRKY